MRSAEAHARSSRSQAASPAQADMGSCRDRGIHEYIQSGIASSLMEEAAEGMAWACLTAVCLHLVVEIEICQLADPLDLGLAFKHLVMKIIAWK